MNGFISLHSNVMYRHWVWCLTLGLFVCFCETFACRTKIRNELKCYRCSFRRFSTHPISDGLCLHQRQHVFDNLMSFLQYKHNKTICHLSVNKKRILYGQLCERNYFRVWDTCACITTPSAFPNWPAFGFITRTYFFSYWIVIFVCSF